MDEDQTGYVATECVITTMQNLWKNFPRDAMETPMLWQGDQDAQGSLFVLLGNRAKNLSQNGKLQSIKTILKGLYIQVHNLSWKKTIETSK